MKNLKSYLITGLIAVIAVALYNRFLADKTGISA